MGYKRKRGDKKKLNKLIKIDSYFVHPARYNRNFYTRIYLSGCRKYAKNQTNRRIRRHVNFDDKISSPSYYRKVFDCWWTLF